MSFRVFFNVFISSSKSAVYKNTKAFTFFKNLAKNETVQAALILLIFVVVSLSTPLLSSKDHYFAPADFLQSYNLTRIDSNPQISNGLLGDPTVIILPWYMYNRESIFSGKLPLWNPYNGNGVPHIANLQSSVFSPFNIPLYILTLRQALIMIAFLKIYFLGFFTYLFLKKIGLTQLPALVGGIAFMFSGIVILWNGYPLPGAIIVLPAGMYFTQLIFARVLEKRTLQTASQNQEKEAENQNLERAEPVKSNTVFRTTSQKSTSLFWPFVGLSLSIAAGIVGGHPEIFYFSFLLLAAYILYQLILLWKFLGFYRKNLSEILGLVGQFILAGILGATLTAIQLLPFFEYLLHSTVLGGRENATAGKNALQGDLWPLLSIPTLLGNPRQGFAPINQAGTTNFIEANTVFIGGLILFLAILSLYFIRKDKYIRFFGIVALLWIVFAYNLFGLGIVFSAIPGLSTIPVLRSQSIWDFCQAVCAAICLNYFWNRKKTVSIAGLTTILLGGLAFITILFIGIQQLLSSKSNFILPYAKQFLEYVPGQIAYFIITFGVGLGAVCALFIIKTKKALFVIGPLIIIIVFMQSGFLFKDFNPTIEDRYFYPVTDSIKKIQQTIGTKTMAVVGDDQLVADTNMVYKISLPSSYDGVWIKDYDQLYRQTFGQNNFNRSTLNINEQGFQLFGVDYISTSPLFFYFGRDMLKVQSQAVREYYVGEILPNAGITQTFKATVNNLQSVSVTLDPLARVNNCKVNFTLTEVTTGKVITQQGLGCNQVTTNKIFTFNFAPIAASLNKEYKITLTSPDSRPGNAVTAIGRADLNYSDGQLFQEAKSLEGGLVFGYTDYNTQDFKPVAQLSNQVLYQYTAGLSKYHFVGNAQFVQSDTEALADVQKSDFDPAKSVIINTKASGNSQASLPTSSSNDAKVTVISEEADRVTLQVSNSSPGYLVLANSFYPGWKARVNGQATPVLQANYAFSAIEIKNTNTAATVEFYYDPESFRYGLYATLATFVIGLILSFIWLFRFLVKGSKK